MVAAKLDGLRRNRSVLLRFACMLALTAAAVLPTHAVSAKSRDILLVVYSSQGYDLNTVKAFQKATAIKTELVDDSTGPLLARIAAEANNPQWGRLWVDGDEASAALDRQGTLLKHFEPKVSSTAAAKKVIPTDESYIPTGFALACALVYNSAAVSTPPTAWAELTQPKWKGDLGMKNLSIPGPTYPCLAGVMNHLGGISSGEPYFEQVQANGLVINDVNGDTLNALKSGQIKLAIISALSTHIYGPGTAMIVVSIAFALTVVAVAMFGFRWLAPRVWRNLSMARR
ncbi:MAG: ABC transporter substrate-binding protein [Candidatus Dormibacteria bacterium]